MFFPEYSITNEILKNISNIDYSRGIIENTPILPNWENQLKKEAIIRTVTSTLKQVNKSANADEIKKYLDGIKSNISFEIENLTYSLVTMLTSQDMELDEDTLKTLHTKTSKNILPELKQGVYRSRRIEGAADPEEVLAKIVDFFDWYNSRDAKETHPIILAGIVSSQINAIVPFEQTNSLVATLATVLSLKNGGYLAKEYISPVGEKAIYIESDTDLTEYLQAFTESLSYEFANIKEKITLLGRDTKVAKASGRIKLTARQERIIEYLQDYGILRNSDFPKIFKDISEDSVLRDLKVLINEGIVVRQGTTKSSIYELK